ncbi:PiggyBac transposable element-derived protein 3 [Frankliniella fusca]|uniref:PiggyBac transposable element-derived protein 3 n=1 Tax=Frankliniella fusca TaxID=407009 RepID=A0AAE1HNJ3_9NEOP|nr:PiggyBac transposable element-derived protein 3 [Frankliniella fusca]
MRKKCNEIPQESKFSIIDETMIPYKAGVSGLIYDFIIYTGESTFNEFNLSQTESSMGVGAKAVISLCKSINDPSSAFVYFDNWFTGLPLLLYLRNEMDIIALGTIRQNRTEQCPLSSDKDLLKNGRGSSCIRTSHEGTSIVKWADKKVVTLASTVAGIEPQTNVKSLIGYFIGLALVNGYFMYQREAEQLQLQPECKTSKDFRLQLFWKS